MSNKKIKGSLIRDKSLNDKRKADKDSKRIKTRKLRQFSNELHDDSLDVMITREDNFSIGLMIAILVGCFVVGIAVGYFLYKLAINNSNALLIINNLFDIIM